MVPGPSGPKRPGEQFAAAAEQVTAERESGRDQVPDLLGRADHFGGLFELLPTLLSGPGAECITDDHSDDDPHLNLLCVRC